MGWKHGIKCISNGFTWNINHPLYLNGMIGWVIVQWLLYGMRITCPNLLMIEWDIENPTGHLLQLAAVDMPHDHVVGCVHQVCIVLTWHLVCLMQN